MNNSGINVVIPLNINKYWRRGISEKYKYNVVEFIGCRGIFEKRIIDMSDAGKYLEREN